MKLEPNTLLLNGINFLKSKDKNFEKLVHKIGVLSIEPRPLDLSAVCKIIIGQQLSSKAANSIFKRFTNCLENKITPSSIKNISDTSLRNAGISSNKIIFIKNFAEKLESDPLFFDLLKKSDRNTAYDLLIKLKGIGPWSANIIQLFYLLDLNVFPNGDATLEKVYSDVFQVELSTKTKKSYQKIEWASPYKGILAIYLWEYYDRGFFKK